MFRVLAAFGLCFLFTLSLSFAADLPIFVEKKALIHSKKIPLHPKKLIAKPKSIVSQPVAAKSPDTKEVASIAEPAIPTVPTVTRDLTWVLGPMTANADGAKRESSSSSVANIVVDKPGAIISPDMIIELEGHVVKTVQSTVRLDIHVGDIKKSFNWNADEIKSGIFKITLKEKISVGVLPALIPVSAIAFVTQTGEGHAAMVSLEKIMLRYSSPQVVSKK
jgi:hypothetical protein